MRQRKYTLKPMSIGTRERLVKAAARLLAAEDAVMAHEKKRLAMDDKYCGTCAAAAKCMATFEKDGARYWAERKRYDREMEAHNRALSEREALKAAWKDYKSVEVPDLHEVDAEVKRSWIAKLDTMAEAAHSLHSGILEVQEWRERLDALKKDVVAARNEFMAAVEKYDKARDAEAEAAENVAREEREIREAEEAEARQEFAAAEAKMKALGLRQ